MKAIYDQTHVSITHCNETFDFTIDTLPSSELFVRPFAILTAYNPNNILLPYDTNMQHNKELFRFLMQSDYLFDRALGYLDEHSEESYCIYGINFEEAIAIGKMFDQYAIFYRGHKYIGYYECNTLEAITQRLV